MSLYAQNLTVASGLRTEQKTKRNETKHTFRPRIAFDCSTFGISRCNISPTHWRCDLFIDGNRKHTVTKWVVLDRQISIPPFLTGSSDKTCKLQLFISVKSFTRFRQTRFAGLTTVQLARCKGSTQLFRCLTFFASVAL
jgi:hypothetical protein